MPKRELDSRRVIFLRDTAKLTWAAIGRVMAKELGRKVPFVPSATANSYRRNAATPKLVPTIDPEEALAWLRQGKSFRQVGELLAERIGRADPYTASAVWDSVRRFKIRAAEQKSTSASPSARPGRPRTDRQSTARSGCLG